MRLSHNAKAREFVLLGFHYLSSLGIFDGVAISSLFEVNCGYVQDPSDRMV